MKRTTIFGTRIKGRLSPLPIITFKLKLNGPDDKIVNGIGVYVFSVFDDDGKLHVVDAATQVWHDLNNTLVLADGRALPLLEGSIVDRRMRTKVDHVPSPSDNAIEYAKEHIASMNAHILKQFHEKFNTTLMEEVDEAEEDDTDQEVPAAGAAGSTATGDPNYWYAKRDDGVSDNDDAPLL